MLKASLAKKRAFDDMGINTIDEDLFEAKKADADIKVLKE